MIEELDRLGKIVEVLQSSAEELDTVLIDDGLLSTKYTYGVYEVRMALEEVKSSIELLSARVSELSEER